MSEHFCNELQRIICALYYLSNVILYRDIISRLAKHHDVVKKKATYHYD